MSPTDQSDCSTFRRRKKPDSQVGGSKKSCATKIGKKNWQKDSIKKKKKRFFGSVIIKQCSLSMPFCFVHIAHAVKHQQFIKQKRQAKHHTKQVQAPINHQAGGRHQGWGGSQSSNEPIARHVKNCEQRDCSCYSMQSVQ